MKHARLKEKMKSFGFQMAGFYLAAGLVIIVLFSGVVYTVTSEIFVKESVAKTEMAIESGAAGIGNYIRHTKSLLQIYAKDAVVVDFVSSSTDKAPENISAQLTAIKETDADILEVFILRSDGEAIGSVEQKLVGTFNDIRSNSLCISSERAESYGHNDPWTVTIAVPIVDIEGKERGKLGMDLDYCLFMHALSGFNMGNQGNISIIDSNGMLVFHTDKTLLSQEDNDIKSHPKKVDGYEAKTNIFTHSITIPNTDWTMVGTASLDGLNVLKRQISDMVVLTGVLLFLALLVITATVSKKLTTPLSQLAFSMEDIKSLAELTINENEISETVKLTQSYNHMIQRIKQLMHEIEDNQSDLRRYEIDALTSQINPHFLYNTLDTIVWLSEFRDNDRIIALTKSLAAFFRLSLNGGQPVVSLHDEIEHVKQYLFIQKVRYDEKMTYSFAIDENALVCMVPKIILQPIVENAIYHGIKPMEGTGHIQIEAHLDGDNLMLSVSDSGVGLDPQENGCQSNKKNGGLGLKNVERRIKLFYGSESSVKIKSAKGKGTTVTLNLKNNLTQM